MRAPKKKIPQLCAGLQELTAHSLAPYASRQVHAGDDNSLLAMQPKPLRVLFDAVHHGKYEFEDFLYDELVSNFRPAQIKYRKIFRPNKKLKSFLVFLNTFIFEHLAINERVVYAYRKGRNPHEVAFAHRFGRAFLQVDIEDFFGSVDRGLVRSTILEQTDRLPISDIPDYIDRVLEMTTINNSLPLGFPTSPPISNVCLTKFDDEFENYCQKSELVYTRYADDIFVSGKDRESLEGVEARLNEMLEHFFAGRLRLNVAKRKLTTIGRKVRILGMVILPNGRVTIDMELKKKVEVRLFYYLNNRKRFLDICGTDPDSSMQELSGYINYINSADQPYLERLKRKFGAAVIDSFLHRSAQ